MRCGNRLVREMDVDQRTAAPSRRPRLVHWPLVALLVAVALVGGCSREFGGNNQRQAQSTSLSDVHEKVDLISHDHCFTGDPAANYTACGGRYLRELQNAAQVASSQASKHPGGDRAVSISQSLIGRIGQFHQSSCDTTASDPAVCAGGLRSINNDLKQLDDAIGALAPGEDH